MTREQVDDQPLLDYVTPDLINTIICPPRSATRPH